MQDEAAYDYLCTLTTPLKIHTPYHKPHSSYFDIDSPSAGATFEHVKRFVQKLVEKSVHDQHMLSAYENETSKYSEKYSMLEEQALMGFEK